MRVGFLWQLCARYMPGLFRGNSGVDVMIVVGYGRIRVLRRLAYRGRMCWSVGRRMAWRRCYRDIEMRKNENAMFNGIIFIKLWQILAPAVELDFRPMAASDVSWHFLVDIQVKEKYNVFRQGSYSLLKCAIYPYILHILIFFGGTVDTFAIFERRSWCGWGLCILADLGKA